jgi:predicted esterase
VILLLALACAGKEPECPGSGFGRDALVTFGDLSTYVHVGDSLPACAPLVVFAHSSVGAGTWDGSSWIEPRTMGLVEAADEQGFALAVPGVEEGEDRHDWTLGEEDADDIDAVFEGAIAGASIDPARAWLVGLSKGGLMAAWYGLEQPGFAKGIAVVSGGYTFSYPDPEPSPKLPFYVAHDPADTEVPYEQAVALVADLEAHGHAVQFEDWELGDDGHGWNPDLPEAIAGFLDAQ